MIGLDEVGRGAWAGPLLVVAARQRSNLPLGVTDSKLLRPAIRRLLSIQLASYCDTGFGWVSATELDKMGMMAGLRQGAKRALKAINATKNELIIVDGPLNLAPKMYHQVSTVIKADLHVPIVSAASIVAKVARDDYMQKLAIRHPNYNFHQNVGYGTAAHRRAIADFGAIPKVHRMSFKPMKEFSK